MSTIADKETKPTAGAYAGYNAVVLLAGEELSRVDRINFRYSNNIQQIYVVSSRTPLNLPRGVTIRGTINRLYFNTALLRLVVGRSPADIPAHGSEVSASTIAGWMDTDDTTPAFASPDDFRRLPEFTIECQLNVEHEDTDRYHSATLKGVVLDDFNMNVDGNDVVMENVTFFAEGLSISAFKE